MIELKIFFDIVYCLGDRSEQTVSKTRIPRIGDLY